jgi:signal transduction histidine kinase
MFGLCVFLFILSTIISSIIFPNQSISNSGTGYIVYIKVCSVVCCQPLVIIAGRVSKSLLTNAEKELDVKSSFIRFIVHELKIPVNIASVGIDAAIFEAMSCGASDLDGMAGYLSSLDATKYSIITASEMLEDVSTMDKLNSHMITLDKVSVNISKLVLSSVRLFAIEAQKLLINLDVSGCCKRELMDLVILVDKPKVAQVIRNLVSNALKFTPAYGQVAVSLRLMTSETLKSHDSLLGISRHISSIFSSKTSTDVSIVQYIRVEIKDTGRGLTEEAASRLFEDSLYGDSDQRGLGIFISKKLVELHGGRLGAFSPGVNEGSIFYVDLPIKDRAMTSPTSKSARVAAAPDDDKVSCPAAIELSEIFTP